MAAPIVKAELITGHDIDARCEKILEVLDASNLPIDHLTAIALLAVGVGGSRHYGLPPTTVHMFVDAFLEQHKDKPTCPESRRVATGEDLEGQLGFLAPGSETLN